MHESLMWATLSNGNEYCGECGTDYPYDPEAHDEDCTVREELLS